MLISRPFVILVKVRVHVILLFNLTTGIVLKTPFTADIKRENCLIDQNQLNERTYYDEKLDMPMSCGIGLLYKILDEFRISADVYRTEWQDYIYTKSDGTKISLITNKSKDKSNIDPTYQVRFGMEYLLVNPKSHYVIPLRAGVFYDPVPAQASSDDYYGLSLGSGFSMERYAFDMVVLIGTVIVFVPTTWLIFSHLFGVKSLSQIFRVKPNES